MKTEVRDALVGHHLVVLDSIVPLTATYEEKLKTTPLELRDELRSQYFREAKTLAAVTVSGLTGLSHEDILSGLDEVSMSCYLDLSYE